ncbi:MAG: molybdenum ABC transporter ATP-binding protein [bacterium]
MSIQARLQVDRGKFRLDVDLQLPDDKVTAIFGPSGCGKTTLLRAIAGLEPTATGHLQIGDQCWHNETRITPPHQRAVGYVFQEPSLFPHLNVKHNLNYGSKRRGGSGNGLQQSIKLLGIGKLLERMPTELSGGEQQRVAIARALETNPSLLLLDEPLAALDEPRKQEILPYLESLQKELQLPILYVSHARTEVARLADHLVVLAKGSVVADGEVAEVFTRLDLPLAHQPDTETVIDARVIEHDSHYGLNCMAFSGGRFTVSGPALPPGSQAKLQIMARDVSITLKHQTETSILNIFPATVEQLASTGDTQVTVRLKVGDVSLLSRITRKSAEDLQLKPGREVYAQVKSVALMT